MKISAQTTLLGAALALALTSAQAQLQTEKPRVAPDEATAIALVEKDAKTLEMLGGAAKLAEARPWTATGHGEVWLVLSKPVSDPKNPSTKRAVVVSINADTGEVVDVSPF